MGWSIFVGGVMYVPRAYTDDSGTLCAPCGCHTVSLQQLSLCIRYVIETTRLSILLGRLLGREPRRRYGNAKMDRSGEEPERSKCVGDCRAKT